MSGPVASSSRTILTQVHRLPSPSQAQRAVRSFASSSRRDDRHVTFQLARASTTFTLPSLESIVERLTATLTGVQSDAMPSLAGLGPLGGAREEATEVEDALDWDGLLHAVPKSRVSHSRKRMRSANKQLKDRTDFVHCQGCGRPKVAHHICAHCYSFIAREQKAVKKELQAKRVDESAASATP